MRSAAGLLESASVVQWRSASAHASARYAASHVAGTGAGAGGVIASAVSVGAGGTGAGMEVRRPGCASFRRATSAGLAGVLSTGRGASGDAGVRRPARLAPYAP